MEKGLGRNTVIAELVKSPHGDLNTYLPIATQAIKEQAEFYAHLVSWNQRKGQIRDAKVALPVIQLTDSAHPEFTENAVANLMLLDPRNLVRAWNFADALKLKASKDRLLNAAVKRYIYAREENYAKWERTVLQHRKSMKALYAKAKVKPSKDIYGDILFNRKYPAGSVLAMLSTLKNLSPLQAAAEIVGNKIPFLVAVSALGSKQKDPDVLMALIERMSPNELMNNMKRLERLDVRKVPALRAALDEKLSKAAKSKSNLLRAAVAEDAVEDEDLKSRLEALQEKKLDAGPRIEGDWLVIGDRSGSMNISMDGARQVAAVLARLVKGDVHVVFFADDVNYINATGKSLDEIRFETRHMQANGGTNLGAAMQYAIDRKLLVGGIAILSDGGENRFPVFADRYQAYVKKMDVEPTVYFYKFKGDSDVFTQNMRASKIDVQTFDVTGSSDVYSIPNLVPTMRTNRFSLVDEIMAMPLLTLDKILPRKEVAQNA